MTHYWEKLEQTKNGETFQNTHEFQTNNNVKKGEKFAILTNFWYTITSFWQNPSWIHYETLRILSLHQTEPYWAARERKVEHFNTLKAKSIWKTHSTFFYRHNCTSSGHTCTTSCEHIMLISTSRTIYWGCSWSLEQR